MRPTPVSKVSLQVREPWATSVTGLPGDPNWASRLLRREHRQHRPCHRRQRHAQSHKLHQKHSEVPRTGTSLHRWCHEDIHGSQVCATKAAAKRKQLNISLGYSRYLRRCKIYLFVTIFNYKQFIPICLIYFHWTILIIILLWLSQWFLRCHFTFVLHATV